MHNRRGQFESTQPPIPYNLHREAERHRVLEHNTYIRYGFADGPLEHVPDPESEQNLKKAAPTATFNHPTGHKRKRASVDDAAEVNGDNHILVLSPKAKRPRTSRTPHLTGTVILTPAGCTWSARDWSCAYDVAVMTMLSTYRSFSSVQKSIWSRETPLNHVLSVSFDHLLSSQCQLLFHSAYNKICDHLRDHLSICDPDMDNLVPRLLSFSNILQNKSIPHYRLSTHVLLCLLVRLMS